MCTQNKSHGVENIIHIAVERNGNECEWNILPHWLDDYTSLYSEWEGTFSYICCQQVEDNSRVHR